MPKKKKANEVIAEAIGEVNEELQKTKPREMISNISNISSKFNEYQEKHWSLSQKIVCLEAKQKALKDERKEIEKAMKLSALADRSLWTQIEFAF
jgi:hypothetical protein